MNKKQTKSKASLGKSFIDSAEKSFKNSQGYSIFDYTLMVSFAVLLLGMFYLKFAEDSFVQNTYQAESSAEMQYYRMLGLNPICTKSEIAQRYQYLAQLWNPGANPYCENCKSYIEELTEAYNFLSDDAKRTTIDFEKYPAFERLTFSNFEDLVYGGDDVWVIQLYDPTDEDCEKVESLWQATAKEWRKLVRFGRINYREDPRTMNLLPFKWQVFPTVATYLPTGEFEVLPYTVSFDAKWMADEVSKLFMKGVERVNAASAKKFLQLDKAYYDNEVLGKYNVLLLKKQYETPLQYTKAALANHKLARFGAIEPYESAGVLDKLKVDKEKNLVISYVKWDAKGERRHLLKSLKVEKASIEDAINVVRRHTIVTLYQNNHEKFCVQKEAVREFPSNKTEIKPAQIPNRLICVIALTEGVERSVDSLKQFQTYVHDRFKTAYNPRSIDIQYAMVNLRNHLDLNAFLKKSQQKFKLAKDQPNYLIYAADLEAYRVVSSTSCTFLLSEPNIVKELSQAVEDFANNTKSLKDYFMNYDTDLASLLKREDDTIGMALFTLLASWSTVLVMLAAGVTVYVFKKSDLTKGAIEWAGIVLAACGLQCLIFVYKNYPHYFGYIE